MPAPKFLSGLPKPVLFGLYGAVGGLIGALAFGELLWFLLRPAPVVKPVEPPPPPQVAVTASEKVAVYNGGTNTFAVQGARAHFDTPVTVSFSNCPVGVTIPPVIVAPGQTSATAQVTAAPATIPGVYKLIANATATAGDQPLTASARVELSVSALPLPPPRVAVTVSPKIQVYQRGKNTFAVQVVRADFDTDVKVTFTNLPDGVKVPSVIVPAGKTEATVDLTASGATPLVLQKVTVKAHAEAKTKDGTDVDVLANATTIVQVLPSPKVTVDIVFVLDVTGSMGKFIDGVKDGIKDFVSALEANQIDARVALVAFRDGPNSEPSEVLKFGGDAFTTDIDAFKKAVGELKADGGGDDPESSLDGLTEASELKFRGQTTRVLLLITDAPPKLPDLKNKTVADAVKVLQNNKVDQIHLVTKEKDLKNFYKPFQDKFAGKHFDLERVNKGGEKFAKILPELSKAISNLVAEKPGGKPDLPPVPPPVALPAAAAATAATSAAPAPPPKIEAPAVKSLQSTEESAAGTEGLLVLRSAVWTGVLAALVCLALLTGQKNYLQGGLPPVGGILAAAGGGLLVGLVGGAAGQGLFFLAPESAVLGHIFRVLGWALLGGLAGTGLAFFIPNLKPVYGLAGGALGGAVGALGFIAVSSITGDLVGRLVGGLLLGFCIGVMVAVVEQAFRQAWLEVRYGPREMVTVNLGAEPVKIGGDARACTVWARGAAPIALRFFIRDGAVLCEDATTRAEAVVGDGTTRTAGNVTVMVRTGRGAPQKPAPQPRPAAPAPKRVVSDDDDFLPLPMDAAPRPAPAKPVSPRPAAPAARPLDLDDDPLPPVPAKPQAPPTLPRSGSRPTMPAAPAKPPTAPAVPPHKPAIAAPTKTGDGCPQCGRKVPGVVGKRYCMMCDETF